jgi:uncharacterized membrane protein
VLDDVQSSRVEPSSELGMWSRCGVYPGVCESAALEYPLAMGKWLEIAQKMAQAARAGLAIERKRLNEILAEQQRKQVSSSSQSSR